MNQPLNFAVFVSGRGSNLKALLDARAAGRLANANFVAVISDRADPPAFAHARAAGIPVASFIPRDFPSKKEHEEAVLAALAACGAQWIALAGYMRLVGPTLLGAFAGRIINIHPSLLPSFPGLHPQRQAVEHGVKVSGCTVHLVDSGMDTGPIILQRTVPCRAEDDEDTLSARILAIEHPAYVDAIELIAEGRVRVEGRRVFIRDSSAS